MGWFGISAYLGGPILRSVGCMFVVEPGSGQQRPGGLWRNSGGVPAACAVQWLVVFAECRGEVDGDRS